MPFRDRQTVEGQRTGLGPVALAAALWGTGGPAAKQLFLISALDPIEVGFYRLAIAAPLLLLAGLLVGRRSILAIAAGHFRLVAGLAAATALYQLCYYNAVAHAGVSIATLITICMAPPVVALCSIRLLRERMNRRTGLAMAVTLGGTALLIGWPRTGGLAGGGLLPGAAFALCATASYAGMVLTSRRLARYYDPYQLIVAGFGGGALLLLPVVALKGFARPGGTEVLGLLLFLGLIPTALAYGFFFIGMRRTPATASSIVSLLEPMVATFLGLLLFQERIGIAGAIGAVLMICGLLILREGPSAGGDRAGK